MKVWQLVKQFVAKEDGTETVEWGIMAGLLVAGLVGAVALIGDWVFGKIDTLQKELAAQ